MEPKQGPISRQGYHIYEYYIDVHVAYLKVKKANIILG